MLDFRVSEPAKQSPQEAAALRVARPNGWWGMALLAATEATLFGTFIASYFYLRFKAVHWPPPGIEKPELAVPIVLAAVLVATSVPLQLAAVAVRRGRVGTTRFLVALALFVQAGYLAMQIDRFAESLDRFTAQTNAYGSIYYTLLGAHHAHVAAGLLLSAWLLVKLRGGLTNYRLVATESIVLYWHLVNALAIAVTATLLSPG